MAPPPPPPSAGDDNLSLVAFATKKELRVVEILVQLRYTMDMVASAPGVKWKGKRKRSCLSKTSPSLPAPTKPQVKPAENADSPVSPFAFPRGQSAENPRRTSKRKSKKRLEQECIEAAKEGDSLRKDLENWTNHYNQLKAKNSQLKAIKQQVLNSCQMKHESEKERIAGVNLGEQSMTITNHHLQPLVAADPTAENGSSPIAAARFNNGLGPNGIPDLNVAPEVDIEESYHQPLDLMMISDQRARCAEARWRRKEALKIKAMRSKK